MENLSHIELDKKWFDFTSNYVTKLNEVKQDWNALTEEEQELAALWKLEMDMANGGFIQFFCNWGYHCYTYAVRSLAKLDAIQLLTIVQQQYEIIERFEEDDRLEKLWDIANYLTDKEIERINALNHQYWNSTDNIIPKTFDTYKELLGY